MSEYYNVSIDMIIYRIRAIGILKQRANYFQLNLSQNRNFSVSVFSIVV